MAKQNPHWLLPSSPYETYASYGKATGEHAVQKARKATPEAILTEVERSGLPRPRRRRLPHRDEVGDDPQAPLRDADRRLQRGRGRARHVQGPLAASARNPYAILEGMLIAAHVVGAEALHRASRSRS